MIQQYERERAKMASMEIKTTAKQKKREGKKDVLMILKTPGKNILWIYETSYYIWSPARRGYLYNSFRPKAKSKCFFVDTTELKMKFRGGKNPNLV